MPVIDNTQNSNYAELLRRLVAEWKGLPNPGDPPTIKLEGRIPGRPTRVFVRWDDWKDLDHQERARLIFDAAEAVLGLDASLDIMTPLGLTTEEAAQLQIAI
jgi:hypothetical protein